MAMVGMLAGGCLSDSLLKKGKSVTVARKLPVIVGLVLTATIVRQSVRYYYARRFRHDPAAHTQLPLCDVVRLDRRRSGHPFVYLPRRQNRNDRAAEEAGT
jgi:hypothetical protein